jgi:ribonucleoside-triphosphate reductase
MNELNNSNFNCADSSSVNDCITVDDLTEDEFVKNKIEFINRYKKSSNTANSTIDDNSNVANKNVAILNAEIHKSDNLRISRAMVMDKLKELYPDFNAKRYVRDLEDHVIYKHDESSFAGAISPYCVSVTMYPFLMDGIKGLGGLSASPKNLKSFCGIFCNMIFAISSQFAGAVAVSEALMYFTYFCKKEWGDDFYKHADEIVGKSHDGKVKTILSEIQQYWQQIVYTINQPAAARGFQSAFVNFSYFDKPFFEGMFGEFYFPDGTKPDWESLKWTQMEFMKWFNAERLKTVLTFPVETVTLLYKDGKFQDEEMAQFVYDEYARGHSFFTYISDTVDSLASCCLKGDEVIKLYDKDGSVFYTKIKDFVDYNDSSIKQDGNTVLKEDVYIDSYNMLCECSKTKIIGTLKKEYSGAMFTFNVDGKSITVTADHEMMVRDCNGNILSLRADEVAKNIDVYELAIG